MSNLTSFRHTMSFKITIRAGIRCEPIIDKSSRPWVGYNESISKLFKCAR